MLYNIHDSIQNSAVVDTSKKILPEIIALVETNAGIKKRCFPRFKNKILLVFFRYFTSNSQNLASLCEVTLLLWCNQSIKITHQEHEQVFRELPRGT